MENILLAVLVLAVFAFGYYVTGLFGKFMDENYLGCQKSYRYIRMISVPGLKRPSGKKPSDDLAENDRCQWKKTAICDIRSRNDPGK